MARKKADDIVRIESSDLPSQPDGWVEMCAWLKTKHLPYLQAISVDPAKLMEDSTPEEKAQSFQNMGKFLSMFVTGWNWKDKAGNKYPQPSGNADVFGELLPTEFNWLVANVSEQINLEDMAIPKETPSAS